MERCGEDSPQEGALSAVLVNEKIGEAVVAFRGTAGYEWRDNLLGSSHRSKRWYSDKLSDKDIRMVSGTGNETKL